MVKKKERRVFCIDGDGAVIMHMGALPTIGSFAKNNFKHIIINNGAYESVGGQPTVSNNCDFSSIAKACGYRNAYIVQNKSDLDEQFQEFFEANGPSILEIKVNMKSRSSLGRPKKTPIENKYEFIDFIRS
jgi:phosphonopyruvate decarboxylase